jgi:hypothetical protein
MDIYPQDYYVYFYLRPDFTPYYVGKGKGRRAWQKHSNIKPPKDITKIILVEQDLTELQAFILERYYIRWFGRKEFNSGILRNKLEGGEGGNSEISSKINKKRIENGTHNWLKRADGTSTASDRVKNGTNPFQTRKDGTNKNHDRINAGTHNWLKRADGTSSSSDRVKDGTHNFLKQKGKIACYDKNGNYVWISVDTYHSQSGPMNDWEWVFMTSKEGKRRKLLII